MSEFKLKYNNINNDGNVHLMFVLATFGGLLGVFAGFSFMSIVEIIYFFVIRFLIDACVNRNTRNKRN